MDLGIKGKRALVLASSRGLGLGIATALAREGANVLLSGRSGEQLEANCKAINAEGNGKGHVQSLILGAVLFIAAVVLWALGVIGDLLAAQRVMTQRTFERVRRIELQLGVAPSHYEANATVPPATSEREAVRV